MGDRRAAPDLGRRTLRGRPRRIVRAVLLAFLRLAFGLRIEGWAHVPATGGVVVVSNHLHNADPILISAAFPRPLHYMAKQELFRSLVLAWLLRRVGAFPVNRGKADRAALRHAEALLRQGIAVGMFPEGTRSVTRALKPALPGAALIALQTGAPVLPVAITGSERLPGNGTKARRRDGLPEPEPGHRGVRIRFGQPFILPRSEQGVRLTPQAATERMMRAIAALLPPDYRGVYAGPLSAAAATQEAGAAAG